MTEIAVTAKIPELAIAAAALAVELKLPLLLGDSAAGGPAAGDPAAGDSAAGGPAAGDPAVGYRALLQLTASGLELLPLGEKAPGAIRADFGAGSMRHRRRGGHNEPLGRAVGVGKWESVRLVDATAGLGRDAFVLADLGCEVELLERSAPAYALLRDGLLQASRTGDAWLQGVCARMLVQFTDARSWLAQRGPGYCDVVYLDPMFPERKKSARVKKEMWLFQQLLESAEDDAELLLQALQSAARRVVVKRPARAEPLAGKQPDFVIPGKTIRFDVYHCQSLNGHPRA